VLFWVDESRGSQVLEGILGEEFTEDSTLSCDGWSAYSSYHTKLQRCWAHLLRKTGCVAERYEEAEQLSAESHALYDDLTTFIEGERAEASLHLGGLIKGRLRGPGGITEQQIWLLLPTTAFGDFIRYKKN
jgi:hypothetical protein